MTQRQGAFDKRLALAAGGTGGHMFPAEALAEDMRRRGWEVALLTDRRGMRFARKFPADKIIVLPARNPHIRGSLAKLFAGFMLIRATMRAGAVLRGWRPSLVMGFGGYPSAPTILAARFLNFSVGIHEQNAVLGRANRLAARHARFIAHGFETLHKVPKRVRGGLVHTGNPVRDAITRQATIAPDGAIPYIPPEGQGDIVRLLISGGSQGARLFSKVVPNALAQLPPALRERLSVMHQVSETDQPHARHVYEQAGIQHVMAPFFDDMATQLSSAHLVIGRAGASTVSELGILGRPSILVPLEIATDDHQAENAKVLVTAGAAMMLREREFTAGNLASVLAQLFEAPSRLEKMAQKAAQTMPHDAARRLADTVEVSVFETRVPRG